MNLTQQEIEYLTKTIWRNPYIPQNPTEKQTIALLKEEGDVFYGGAAGGGKSVWLLMSALQYVDEPGYNAILIRDTYANLNKPEGLMDRAHEWLQNTDAKWVGDTKTYKFSSGATVGFGYLDSPLDHFNYQSAAYQFVGIDEIVNIRKNQAIYMFSRMRRLEGSDIPIRFRCASNPPTIEQLIRGKWVKERYIDNKAEGRYFVPAKLEDNPHLDKEDYIKQLEQLDPITKAQLRYGDWEIQTLAGFFKVEKVEIVDNWPYMFANEIIRRWDMAATGEPDDNSDPDYTVGLKGGMVDDTLYLVDMVRGRYSPENADRKIKETARADGIETRIIIEQEPGASGKRDISHIRAMLPGYAVGGKPSTGDKLVRARPAASWMNQGKIKLLRGAWNQELLDELMLVSPATYNKKGYHDDIMDDLSGLVQDLAKPDFEVPALNYGISEMQEMEFN